MRVRRERAVDAEARACSGGGGGRETVDCVCGGVPALWAVGRVRGVGRLAVARCLCGVDDVQVQQRVGLDEVCRLLDCSVLS